MKMSQKATIGISLLIGTLLFTTTALAEITSNNGYEQFKTALKQSAEKCSSQYKNYTMSTSFDIKDGGKLCFQEDQINKYDNSNCQLESTSLSTIGGEKKEGYYYGYQDGYITYDNITNKYCETCYTDGDNESILFSNPFKESGASDIEKIVDAIVGNLKDYVVVDQKTDGSKELSGSISEAQIPAIVNALASYFVKGEFGNEYTVQNYNITKISDDVYVKEIKANVVVGKDGVIQNIVGTGIISAKDEKGNVHEFTFEVLGKLTDINLTTVKRPNLTGKNVEVSTLYNQGNKEAINNPEKYLGTYKNDIVIQKDNKFQKIGERIVDITQINDTKIIGRYHEEFLPGYDEYLKEAIDFNFDDIFVDDQKISADFKVNDTKGITRTGNISICLGLSNINLYINEKNNSNIMDDISFNKVFK